ncbi:MAG: terpene cyclase/mutase family protein [Planctomycetota bacterium]|nr:terpene cyclase/mutase family protein [Planctomycetota bacterium]
MTRPIHQDAFQPADDFNEQLYGALRQSPWWMTSVALHVLLFFILTLFDTTEAATIKRPPLRASMDAEKIEEDIEDPVDEDKQIHEQEIPTDEPVITDEPVEENPVTDNDMPHNEMFGESEGDSDAPYEGPSSNGLVGIGGGAGGAFPGRGGNRNGGSSGYGGGKELDAIDDALRWLAAHQSPDGGWEAAGFNRWCDGKPVSDASQMPDGLGKALYDPGVTGLALCAFLGAGYTNRGKHPFNKVVGRGLRYLKNIQDPEGCFGPRNTQQYIYNHATAALAMVEAYGMTGSSIWRGAAQRGLDFIALARNPYFAWRYGIKPGANDTSVSGWMMMALKSAQLVNKADLKRGRKASLTIDESSFEGLKAWLDKVTDPDYGRVGYTRRGEGSARPLELVDRFPGEKTEAMTAVGLLARIFMGEDPRKSEIIKRGAQLCSKLPPTWNATDGSIDMYYWYYATLAMFQVGGKSWDTWRRAMDKAMIDPQRKDTDYCQYKGSWDPIGPWGGDGGRVYSTAIMALCLEVYQRYDLVFGAK